MVGRLVYFVWCDSALVCFVDLCCCVGFPVCAGFVVRGVWVGIWLLGWLVVGLCLLVDLGWVLMVMLLVVVCYVWLVACSCLVCGFGI